MRILFIGDTVGEDGCRYVCDRLPSVKRENNIDAVIINGENSANGNGITPKSAGLLLSAGVDCITGGNHSFQRAECAEVYERDNIIRPLNFKDAPYGNGTYLIDFVKTQLLVVNLIGTVFINEEHENPFLCMDKLLESAPTKNIFVDFHAEATSEKRAMGLYLAGRVSALVGTHTHIQTADEEIINGMGYITDVGMVGGKNSVIGVTAKPILDRFIYKIKTPVKEDTEDIVGHGVVIEIDEKTGKCSKINRIIF